MFDIWEDIQKKIAATFIGPCPACYGQRQSVNGVELPCAECLKNAGKPAGTALPARYGLQMFLHHGTIEGTHFVYWREHVKGFD